MAPTEWNRTAEDRWLLRAAWLVLHPSFPSASVCTWISALGPLHLDLCAQGLAALCSNHGVVRGGMKLLGSLASAGLISLSFLLTAKAQVEPSFPAQCFAIGDSVILQSTGEHVLEQRLVRFTPTQANDVIGQLPRGSRPGLCVVKTDPPGYKWIGCSRLGNQYVTGVDSYKVRIVRAVANQIQYRGWSGACLVKYLY